MSLFGREREKEEEEESRKSVCDLEVIITVHNSFVRWPPTSSSSPLSRDTNNTTTATTVNGNEATGRAGGRMRLYKRKNLH